MADELVIGVDPGATELGRGPALADDLLPAPARSAYAASVSPRDVRSPVPIRAAALGNTAGVVGIAALARSTVTGAAHLRDSVLQWG